ncbi:MAG: peptide chain release factor N(5)-glutamine methyltransferase [Lachnospirales bacterium]
MKNVSDVLYYLKDSFKNGDIDTYSLDAQLILMKALNISKIKLITHPEMEVDEKSLLEIEKMKNERHKMKPMQYILGKCEFMGLDFYVNENTLIPRGDTEILVEQAIATINDSGFNSVLDIGTGSGAIGVSIAYYTKAKVTSCDISDKALEVARKNARENNVEVEFIKSDLFENIKGQFDVIVSNPPYIESDVINTLSPQVKDYEPIIALDGGKDGLKFYRLIVQNCHKFLSKGGYLMFEIGYNQGEEVKSIMENADFSQIQVKKDLSGLDRLVIGKKL